MAQAHGGGSRTFVGWTFTLIGVAGLVFLFGVLDLDMPVFANAPYKLGLALMALLSAVAQVSLLVGVWLLWTSRRRL